MQTRVILLFLLAAMQSSPQFGFGNSQNCVGSQCNQNNIGISGGGQGGGFRRFRGNRQFCVGSQCNQNIAGDSGRLGGHRQFCVGGQCSKNVLDKKKRSVTEVVTQDTMSASSTRP